MKSFDFYFKNNTSLLIAIIKNRKKLIGGVERDIVKNYNNSFHSTIKSTPQKVFDGKQFNTQQVFYIPNPFDVGDKVRLKKRFTYIF